MKIIFAILAALGVAMIGYGIMADAPMVAAGGCGAALGFGFASILVSPEDMGDG